MRGSNGALVTSLAVALVAGIALVAAVDAVRARGADDRDHERATRATPSRLAGVSAELRAAGVEGTLAYVDRACRLHVLALPALRQLDVTPLSACRLRPVFAPPRGLPISASASAVGSDGSVAFLRDGDVALWADGCIEAVASPCARTILPRTALARAVGARTRSDVAIDEVAPLGDDRLAAVVRDESGRPARTVIAVFDGRRLVATVPWFRAERVSFTLSPSGEYVALTTRRPNRLFLLDRDGRVGVLADVARSWFGRTSLHGARAIAWSPDERWTALAKNESVYVFTTRDEPDARLVRLPIAARDLAWH